ncbi:MAG TPA: NADH-quinone oxidoreductase subunit NuoF [Candidatus Aminicenantes bacterium]|nr:NADH-quinone oxidoreductase subunit NuoF [Candidatus Aminicenantes bacterium]
MNKKILKRFDSLRLEGEKARSNVIRPGSTIIQVGSATCENAAGAREIREEFRKHIASSGRADIVLHDVGCTGRCSLEPIVGILRPGERPVKYQQVSREGVHRIFTDHVLHGQPVAELILDGTQKSGSRYEILFCRGERCGNLAARGLQARLRERLEQRGVGADVVAVQGVNFADMCVGESKFQGGHFLVRPGNHLYRVASDADLERFIDEHLLADRPVQELIVQEQPIGQNFFELYGDISFFNRQSRIALRNSGIIDPTSLPEYLNAGGFHSLARVLAAGDPDGVIAELSASKLRGRGGGGFPTGSKWQMARKEPGGEKYIICNADEGDPGAFMDRSMLEGDPFSVVEGMIIGGFAIGASRGFFYVRAEYPLAIERIENALAACRKHGLLGEDILGSGFSFDLEIRLGAGAFVCGEETALIHSIEGERGQPRIRPPYPSQSGLWGKPTVINNVETFANVPVILEHGAEWFRHIGSDKSGGTKVFALAGKVNHTGLVEVPIGTTLREIIMEIGGGCPKGKRFKAVQTGGPAGGCIPATHADLAVDYDTLTAMGTIMGSGGMIVMDEDDCMVDIAKFFMKFSADESCGKCTPCREGSKRMLEILERITAGEGREDDIAKLERLGLLMKRTSLCGLGRAAANPVLSTLRHYREEYAAHITEHRCPAKRCAALVRYSILADKCVGCTACARNCPANCIAGAAKKPHAIDPERCIKCGRCFRVCRFGAVERN